MQKKITRQNQYFDTCQTLLGSRVLADFKANKDKPKNKNTFNLRKIDSKKYFSTSQIFLDSNGSALVVALSLLPLIVGSLLAAFVASWMIHVKNELLFTCEKGLLRTQSHLVEAENELEGLNSPIEINVMQKKILKKALIAAKTPVEVSIIKAKLLLIEGELAVLKKKQRLLISMAHIKAQQEMFGVSQKMKSRLDFIQLQWSAQLFSATNGTTPRIQLIPQKIDPSADIYVMPSGFNILQTLNLQWQLKGSRLFPSWLHYLKEKNFSWQDSCSSRPAKKENGLWTAEIGKGI